MALTFIKRSAVPVSVKGKTASDPSVSISDKGQLTLNTLATKYLGGLLVAIAYDAGKLYMFKREAKVVAKLPESEFFTLRASKKGGTSSMAATNLLRSADVFGDNLYDFGASGNQTFKAEIDDKNGALVIALPKGSLARKAVVARKKKSKGPQIVKAEAGSTDALPATEEDELILSA